MSDFNKNVHRAFNDYQRAMSDAVLIEVTRLTGTGLSMDEITALIMIKTDEAVKQFKW